MPPFCQQEGPRWIPPEPDKNRKIDDANQSLAQRSVCPKSCFLVFFFPLEVNLKTWDQDHSAREHRSVLLREEKAWQSLRRGSGSMGI